MNKAGIITKGKQPMLHSAWATSALSTFRAGLRRLRPFEIGSKDGERNEKNKESSC